MRKLTMVVPIIILFAFVLASCGGDDEDDADGSDSSAKTAAEKVAKNWMEAVVEGDVDAAARYSCDERLGSYAEGFTGTGTTIQNMKYQEQNKTSDTVDVIASGSMKFGSSGGSKSIEWTLNLEQRDDDWCVAFFDTGDFTT